jgi:leucyl/phenylalanyl-tRNA--protein transferase
VSPPQRLPDPDDALLQPAGLCGIVHDLSVPTLLAAHRRGLYPFAHIMPLKWWSPPQRCVLAFGDFHMSRRMRSRLRQARYRVTFDRDFEGVIKACAGRREGKWHVTWITPPIMHAYAALHDAGHAHSFEVWNCDGALVGGGYGVAVGGAFTVESQFTRESHTSKIGFAVLNWHLAHWGFQLNDNKGPTPHLLEMGFRIVPRRQFQTLLAQAAQVPGRPGRWSVEADLQTVAEWQPDVSEAGAGDAAEPSLDTPCDSKVGRLAPLVPAIDVLDGELMGLSHALAVLL